jgi:hypothetical protein
MAQTFFHSDQFSWQERKIRAAPIFPFAAFEEIPDALLRVQLGSVTGKTFQMESPGCPCGEKCLDGVGTMDWGAIPNDQEFPSDLAQQHP